MCSLQMGKQNLFHFIWCFPSMNKNHKLNVHVPDKCVQKITRIQALQGCNTACCNNNSSSCLPADQCEGQVTFHFSMSQSRHQRSLEPCTQHLYLCAGTILCATSACSLVIISGIVKKIYRCSSSTPLPQQIMNYLSMVDEKP